MRWRVGLVALAAAAAWMPTPPGLVERFYSLRAYAMWQRPMTALSHGRSSVRFPCLLVIGAWLRSLSAISRERRTSALRRGAHRLARRLGRGPYVIFLLVGG